MMSEPTAAIRPQRARRAMAEPVAHPVEVAAAPSSAPAPVEPAPQANGNGHVVPGRPPGWVRRPFGAQSKRLAEIPREGFYRRWINDYKNRIERAQEAGYDFVKDKDGKPMMHHAGTHEGGGGMKAYYMEIPLEWYREDQAVKDRRRDDIDRQLKRGQISGVEPGKDGAYLPMNKSGTVGPDIKRDER